MERERVSNIIAAYGADPARWPAEERDAAQALFATDLPLRRQAEDAASLDALLRRWAAAGPADEEIAAGAAAEAALAAADARPGRRWLPRLFGGVGIAAAVVAALAISPILSDQPVALPAKTTPATATMQTASTDGAADAVDQHLWSMTFTPTPDEESLI